MDQNTSLPIRTEAPGDVQVRLGDGTTPAQYLAIDAAGLLGSKLYDGAGTAITSQLNGAQQALDVGINVAGVQIDPRQIRALTAADVVTVQAIVDPLPAGTNSIGKVGIQVGGTDVSSSNPVPVILAPGVSGTEVHNYNTAAALGAGATSNHDYTITAGKSFKGEKFWASASGKLRVEVQISDAAGSVFSTKWVGFNSTANPNIDIFLGEVLASSPVSVTGKIRIIRKNLENQAQDVYSTISGSEI